MSLINDALKRAQQQQQENPPPVAPLEFRAPDQPVTPTTGHTTLLFVGLGLVVILLLGLTATLIWYVRHSQSEVMPVAARVVDPPLVPVVAAPPRTAAEPPGAAPTPGTPQFEHPEEPNTNRIPVVAELVAAAPAPALKLQGIAFNPSAPTVIINGRILGLGDRINGLRLIAISPVAATLANATTTNVLSLSE